MLFRFASRNKLFRQGWINWFLLPYHQHRDGFADLNLRVVAFRHPITMWGNLSGLHQYRDRQDTPPISETLIVRTTFQPRLIPQRSFAIISQKPGSSSRGTMLRRIRVMFGRKRTQTLLRVFSKTRTNDTFKSSTVAVQDTG